MKNLFIILENPKYAGNIGMVCRLIANFNLPPLRVVGEKNEFNFEMEWMAYNSNDEISKIQYYATGKECRLDLDVLIGTAMIQGKDRPGFLPIDSLYEKWSSLKDKKVGFIFGREDRGLSNTTIDICDYMVDFELSPKQPSMNLSQSVSFVLGCLHSPKSNQSIHTNGEPLDKTNFYKYAQEIFLLLEMNQFHGRENLAIKRFRKIIDSSSISSNDLNFLYALFKKIEMKIKNE